MKRETEHINKAMLQMIIDHNNRGRRLICSTIYDDHIPYQFMTDGYVGYLLPSCDCYIIPPCDTIDYNLANNIFPVKSNDQIDTSTVFTRDTKGAILRGYKTPYSDVMIDIRLLRGFGSTYTIYTTDSKTIYAVHVNGNLRGIVCGKRV